MKLAFNAGQFGIETWTESHPMWMQISYRGKEIAERFSHEELSDLIYILTRMRAAGRANMPERYKHEFD